jgi:hypothetical protein
VATLCLNAEYRRSGLSEHSKRVYDHLFFDRVRGRCRHYLHWAKRDPGILNKFIRGKVSPQVLSARELLTKIMSDGRVPIDRMLHYHRLFGQINDIDWDAED